MKKFIIVKCTSCDNRKKIYAGEVKKGEQPMCDKCFMPMVAEKAGTEN